MPLLELALICATVLAALVIIAAARVLPTVVAPQKAPGPGDYTAGTALVVHTGEGQSFRGKVAAVDAAVVHLEDVHALAGGEETPVGGRWRFNRDQVTEVAI